MNFSPSDFVSVNEILADVLKIVGDSDFKRNSPGWYKSQIRQCLQELAFDTFFDDQHQSFDMPENLRLELPKGSFNLQQVYAYNGDECTPSNSQNVYWKRNFINGESGKGYVARNNYTNDNDPFHKQQGATGRVENSRVESQRERIKHIPDNVYFYNIQGGLIMLSPNCSNFQKVMLVYSGVSTDISDEPIVPIYLRQAVKEWTSVEALTVRLTETIGSPEYNQVLSLFNIHERKLNDPYEGDWIKAERRVNTMDFKERQDTKEYLSRLNH